MVNGVNCMFNMHNSSTQKCVKWGFRYKKKTVLERLSMLKTYGQCSVVIDLIYGLPGQTARRFGNKIIDLARSGVDGADLYQLNVFDGDPD